MHWRDVWLDFDDAWSDVRSRPFRSALSAIGICVGVLALVAMISITGGAREEALASATSLGLDKIRVERSAALPGARSSGLTAGDAERVDLGSGVKVRTTWFQRRDEVPVQSDVAAARAEVLAVPLSFFELERLRIARGTLWAGDGQAMACVVGASLARRLDLDPGDTLVVGSHAPCTVTGIMAAHPRLLTEGTGLSAIDFDASVFVPFAIVSGRYAGAAVTGLISEVHETEAFPAAIAAVTRTLEEAHVGERDFIVVVPRTLAQQVDETQQLFTLIMSTIAGLALLVGGIGIANSLLATVAEQTREIGLRMAVGARPARVLSLYVLHAVCICAVGAVVGAVLGLGVAGIVQVVADWRVHLSGVSVLVGVGFALLTGALSASYPAFRASRMSPASALIDH